MTPHGGDVVRDADMGIPPNDEDTAAAAAAAGFLRQEQERLAAAHGTVLEACHAPGGEVMATASSTGAIQVWAARQGGWSLLHTEQLPATDNQPTQLVWANPQHGQVLAVGTRTGSVHILQGPVPASSLGALTATDPQRRCAGWSSTARLQCGKGAVSALAFAPHQQGLVLAAACSRQQWAAGAGSGCVQFWEAAGKASTCAQWTLVSKFELSEAAGSCSCLCWRESTPGLPPLLLGGHADGGSIWGYHSPNMAWQELATFSSPAGAGPAALSVHWAPALGRPYELIAASFGSSVTLFKVVQQTQAVNGSNASATLEQAPPQLGRLEVVQLQKLAHPAPVWKLGFSGMGTTLACSLDGRPEVWLWMPLMDGAWAAVSRIGGGGGGEHEEGNGGGGVAGGEGGGIMVD